MKIGFLGNTNNYPFILAMLFREMGHSVFFVVTEKSPLHRPESRYPEFKAGYPDWITDLSDLAEWEFFTLSPRLAGILGQLSQCDALVLNSFGLSCLPFLNLPAIALLTGSDLTDYANLLSVETRTANYDPAYKETPAGKSDLAMLKDFINRQRLGIQNSALVRWFPHGLVPEGDRLLDELGIPASKRHFFAMANPDILEFSPAPHNQTARVFCGARLTWKLPVEPGRALLDYKGGDVMIRGLGQFYRETGTRLEIRLVRKGLHLKETEDLIAEEGIADQVIWLEEMSLVDYWQEIERADIIFDQLAKSLPFGPVYDAMAVGRPAIANARPEISSPLPLAPICQAETPQEVCRQLKRLVFNPQEREQVGRLGRAYVEQYLDPRKSAIQIEQILAEASHARRQEQPYNYMLQTLVLRWELQQELAETRQELDNIFNALSRLKPFLRVFNKLPILRKYIPAILLK